MRMCLPPNYTMQLARLRLAADRDRLQTVQEPDLLPLYLFIPAGCVALIMLAFAGSGDATLNFFAVSLIVACVGLLSWRRNLLTRSQLFARAALTSSGILLPAAVMPALNVPVFVGVLLLGPIVFFIASLLIGAMIGKLRRGTPDEQAA